MKIDLHALNDYRQLCQQAWPDLEIKSFVRCGEGMDSVVFLANQDLIVRFPKYARASASLKRELRILSLLQSRVSLAIPAFCRQGKISQPQNDWLFVAYPSLAGRPLVAKDWEQASPQQQKKWAGDLKVFLEQVHSFPREAAQQAGFQTMNRATVYQQNLRDLRSLVWSYFDAQAQRCITKMFAEFLGNPANHDYEPVLLHADLSPEHIFFDEVTGEIRGIIDFGDLCLGDPDYDLMYLYSDYSPRMVELMGLLTPAREAKLRFFNFANPLQDLLTHLQDKNESGIAEALDWFREGLQAFT